MKPTDEEVQRVMDDNGMDRMQAYRHVEGRITLRQRAAERYPTHLTDSMGRQHLSVVRRAIMSGQWDGGTVVDGEGVRDIRSVDGVGL